MAKCKTCGAPVNLAPDGDPKYEAPRQAALPKGQESAVVQEAEAAIIELNDAGAHSDALLVGRLIESIGTLTWENELLKNAACTEAGVLFRDVAHEQAAQLSTLRQETVAECAKVTEAMANKAEEGGDEDYAAAYSECTDAILALSPSLPEQAGQ